MPISSLSKQRKEERVFGIHSKNIAVVRQLAKACRPQHRLCAAIASKISQYHQMGGCITTLNTF
jgi:hypothetical protein